MTQPRHYNEKDLFERYYAVQYRHFDARTEDNIRRHGVRVSGVPSIDVNIERYEVISELTIDSMFELWRRGVTVRVVNYSDTEEIYDIIHRHLLACAEYLQNSVNRSSVTLVKELVELDKFASVVYDKAKSIFTDKERAAVQAPGFSAIQEINFFNILNSDYSRVETVRVVDGKEKAVRSREGDRKTIPVREREDLSQVFIEHIDRIGGVGAGYGKK